MVGQEVMVEGQILVAESFSAGFKLTLGGSTGQIVLLLWEEVYVDCWDRPGLNIGSKVRVTGILDEYAGELQVQPTWGGGVRVIEPAAAWAEPRQIGSLSGSDEGRRVMVEGQVLRTAGGNSWVKVFLADESGETGVFIWRNVLDLIPNNTGLGTAGSHVRVVGTVTIYQSNLEIVPTLPYDVTVLEMQ
jgi:DNA/RNA endonuclease YhcR with UshA esterase domain